MIEKCEYICDSMGFAVEGLVCGVRGLAVASEVPEYEGEVLGEDGDLLSPHFGGG